MPVGTLMLAVVLHVSRSSPSAKSGLTPAETEGLEASFVTRAPCKDTGWLVCRLAGIPMSDRLATSAAARMAALFPVAVAQLAKATPAARGRRARTESAIRAGRNMVAH